MKNIFFILCVSLLFCGWALADDKMPVETKDVAILTSFYPVYIMAINVTKDVPGVSVANLTGPSTGCLHDYALTTSDMKKLSGASIFFVSGAGLESFVDRITQNYPKLQVVALSNGIDLIRTEDGRANPHVWVSLSGAMKEVEHLAYALERIDPVHARLYRKNSASYIKKLQALMYKANTMLEPYAGAEIVTFHEAFSYFAAEFDLKIVATVEGETHGMPSPQDVAKVVKLIKRAHVKAIFTEPQYSPAAAELIGRETGLKIYQLDPAVTGPDDPDAYIWIMEKNLQTLIEALQ